LLSIKSFTNDNNCIFEFDNDNFLLKDKLSKNPIMKGKARGLLYPIRLKSASFKNLSAVKIDNCLHHILGHLSSSLQKKLSTADNKNIQICNSCNKMKSHKQPFSKSRIKTSDCLQIIHCDVWGPSPSDSLSSFHYYISFIDDYSRYTRLFPLTFKSDTFPVFKQFKALVKNLFDRNIKIPRSDGGREFMFGEFTKFLQTEGIQHQVSYPYTLEQNDMVERKHHHIIETGLSLLDFAGLPRKFWLKAFTTAVYPINRMPLKIDNDQDANRTPYEYLFKRTPDYSHLHAFDCLCYPWLRPYHKNKLEERSAKCIFLGYNMQHKGYRCLDIDKNKMHISLHVVFYDHVFPFKTRINSEHEQSCQNQYDTWIKIPNWHPNASIQ
jgi:hypothetical protein